MITIKLFFSYDELALFYKLHPNKTLPHKESVHGIKISKDGISIGACANSTGFRLFALNLSETLALLASSLITCLTPSSEGELLTKQIIYVPVENIIILATLINFALADHLAIDIEQGFNVLTGETGAGKSLLLDALSACLGERTDTNYVRYGSDKADITAVFTYQNNSPEAKWLQDHELDDDSGEIHLRRVIFATGRSKAWVNGRPSSLSELKELGRLLVQLYSQHSQQQLLEPPYPKHWLDRYNNFYAEANDVREAYSTWQRTIRLHQAALDAQATRLQRIGTLEHQIEELEEVIQTDYKEIEQEFDRLSHHEHIITSASRSSSLSPLSEAQ